jgi:PAP2 superfamily
VYEPVLRLPQARSLSYLSAVDWPALRDELTPMLGFVLVYALGAQALLVVARLHFSPATVWLSVWIDVFPWLIIPALLTGLIHARLSVRDGHGSRIHGWHGWIAGYRIARVGPLSPTALVRVMAVVLVFPVFHRAFTIYKSAIPLIRPFHYDSLWTKVDRWIHFGRLPYQLLPSFLTTPGALHWLETLYLSWHAVVGCAILWITMQSDSALRRRFYFAFLATWVLVGNVAALAASSGGPCYYFALVGGGRDPYAALLHRLALDGRSIPYTLGTQWQLWRHYRLSSVGVGTGISAMPSMHVAMPVLFAHAAYRKDAALSILFASFGVAILIGSIALGWHYGIDGYFSIVAVSIVWWASGRLVARQ